MHLKTQKQASVIWAMAFAFLAAALFMPPSEASATKQTADIPYDLMFIDMLIMHDQEGIEMAQMEVSRGEREEVKTFAKNTAAKQQKQIDELQAYRRQWYADKPAMDRAMMMSTMMPGKQSKLMMNWDETKKKLESAKGAELDRLLLDALIQHHQMTVKMEKAATTQATHPELKEFARTALKKQKEEVSEMKDLERAEFKHQRHMH